MKFQEARCLIDEKLYTPMDMEYIKSNDLKKFTEIKADLFCPECGIAQLYYTAETPNISGHFSSYPKSLHVEGCSLTQDEYSARSAIKFVNDKTNEEKILKQMDNILEKLLVSPKVEKTVNKTVQENDSTTQFLSNTNLKNSQTKRLKQKRIDYRLDEDDFDCFKVFYGKVIIKNSDCQTTDKKRIELFNHKNKDKLLTIYLNKNIQKYIDKNILEYNNIVVNVAVVASLVKPKQEPYIPYTNLTRSTLIRVIKA